MRCLSAGRTKIICVSFHIFSAKRVRSIRTFLQFISVTNLSLILLNHSANGTIITAQIFANKNNRKIEA